MTEPTAPAPHFCSSCGAPLVPGAHFCASCGTQVPNVTAQQPPITPGPPATPLPPPVAPVQLPPGPGATAYPTAGGPPHIAPPVPYGAAEPKDRRKKLGPILAISALAVVLIAGVVFLVTRDGGGTHTELAAGEVFLEPTATIGPDPFTDRVLESAPVLTTTTVTRPPTTVAPSAPPRTAPATATSSVAPVAMRTVNGDTPGLYGGTGSRSRCDREGMITFLQTHPAQANAWVAALNTDPTLRWSGGNRVRVDQIAAYIRELTPVTLLEDTRVTNHGFAEGRPTPRQSVLQAGTAVLVDRFGVPRARCACGNPLLPPQPAPVPPSYRGPQWPGFTPTNVVIINQVTIQVNVFVLTDMLGGGRFDRPSGTVGDSDSPVRPPSSTPSTTTSSSAVTSTTVAATTSSAPATTAPPMTIAPPTVALGTGDVQATLLWGSDNDLDLYVTDPSGIEIFFGNPSSPTGGNLDYDTIPDCGDSATHVENVFWPPGGAPRGEYLVRVMNLGGCQPASAYRLEVRVNGQVVAYEDGYLNPGDQSTPIPIRF